MHDIFRPVLKNVFDRVFRYVPYSPSMLFSQGEQGAWYDPSDLNTMFQDTAGTSPVTTPGQSVARVNDKSGRGNNATQSTALAMPKYGIVPSVGRRNLLTYTENIANSAWVASNTTVTPNAAIAPDGTLTASRLQIATGAPYTCRVVQGGLANQPNKTVTFSAYVWCASGTQKVTLGITQSGVVDNFSGYNTITTTPTRIQFTATFSSGGTAASVRFTNGADGVGADFYVWGAQFEVASTATAYQRVSSQYDVTEAGVPSCSYLRFDGGDSMSTGSIDFSATDKMTLWAGATVSGTSQSILAELSANTDSNNGGWNLQAPLTASGEIRFTNKGTASATADSSASAVPFKRVISGVGDIGGDVTTLRLNGVQTATSSADLGTGYYGNYPIYIGARTGASLFFSGDLFGLIVRGAQSSVSQITETETWVSNRTGVVI